MTPIPLLAQGDFFARASAAHLLIHKKRGWVVLHNPASITSKALPDSPGRAARKLAGMELFSEWD
jgi:hypothetical protein